jgi:hypothetical protein
VAKFYTLLLNTGDRTPTNNAIQHVLDSEIHWLRFSLKGYLIKSEKSAAQLYDLVKPVLHTEDTFMIIEANLSNRKGWVGKMTREWLSTQTKN